jgi:hypothetical protein
MRVNIIQGTVTWRKPLLGEDITIKTGPLSILAAFHPVIFDFVAHLWTVPIVRFFVAFWW